MESKGRVAFVLEVEVRIDGELVASTAVSFGVAFMIGFCAGDDSATLRVATNNPF